MEDTLKQYTSLEYNENTGIDVITKFNAASGFNYLLGVRELEGIYILEQIADGTACTFLCGIKILSKKDKTLIKEIDVDTNEHYTRQKCLNLVENALIEVLLDAAKKDRLPFDHVSARTQVAKLLDVCYFEQSRKAAIEWAMSIGIIS